MKPYLTSIHNSGWLDNKYSTSKFRVITLFLSNGHTKKIVSVIKDSPYQPKEFK